MCFDRLVDFNLERASFVNGHLLSGLHYGCLDRLSCPLTLQSAVDFVELLRHFFLLLSYSLLLLEKRVEFSILL